MRVGCIVVAIALCVSGESIAEVDGDGVVLVVGHTTNVGTKEAGRLARRVGNIVRDTTGVEFRAVVQADDPLDSDSPDVSCFGDRSCVSDVARKNGGNEVLVINLIRITGITKIELARYCSKPLRTTAVSIGADDDLERAIEPAARRLFPEHAASPDSSEHESSELDEGEELAVKSHRDRRSSWSTRRIALWTTGIAAGASLVTGAGFAIQSARLHATPSCDDQCSAGDSAIRDLERSNRNANLFLGVGVGLAATAGLIHLLWEEAPTGTAISFTPAADGAAIGWSGRF